MGYILSSADQLIQLKGIKLVLNNKPIFNSETDNRTPLSIYDNNDE
jgi:hypothetical protein